MKYSEFQSWLSQITELSPEQKEEAQDVLQGKPTESNMSLATIEARVDKERICPRCGASGAISRGKNRSLKRYQCKSCKRTFNALTGTKLSGLHYKERWLAHGKCLAQKKTLKEVALACDIAENTAFRWRHRFLDAAKSNKPTAQLAGIVEADETYFLNSSKGVKTLDRKARYRGGTSSKRGVSKEQVPMLMMADRTGVTASHTLDDGVTSQSLKATIAPHIQEDAVLVTDSHPGYSSCAKEMNINHEKVNLSKGERVRGAFHIQTVNSRHSEFKSFLTDRKGISTKYLDNYFEWFHSMKLEKKTNPRHYVSSAVTENACDL